MRIIAGKFGGRTLKTLSGQNITRPTSDKVKGAIFSMLGDSFDGGYVLDLYAGTGALGIEAVSRGSDFAVLVDRDPKAQKIISENIEMLHASEQFLILKASDKKALSDLTKQILPHEMNQQKKTEKMQGSGEVFLPPLHAFDLVFLDPPYAKEALIQILTLLSEKTLLADGAYVVCESERSVILPSEVALLRKKKEKVYGITRISLFEKI